MSKLTAPQLAALQLVSVWSKPGGTYMPRARHARTFEVCVRKGVLEYRSVDHGSPYNGYALTDAGRQALQGTTP